MSFPLRERGLKQVGDIVPIYVEEVVPLAGTWIETTNSVSVTMSSGVVPLAGTWIETEIVAYIKNNKTRRSPCGNVD